MVLEARTERGERQGRHVVDEHHAVRVAHRDTGDPVLLAADLERPLDDLAVGIDRNAPAVPDGRPHVDGDAHHVAALDLGLDDLYARIGLDAERDLADQAAIVDELGEATDAIAAHLGEAAVGVEDPHAAIGGRGVEEQDEAVRADAAVAVAEHRRERSRVGRESTTRVDVHEVVRGAVELCEGQRGHCGERRLRGVHRPYCPARGGSTLEPPDPPREDASNRPGAGSYGGLNVTLTGPAALLW